MKNLNYLIILIIFLSVINLKFINSQECIRNDKCGNNKKECKFTSTLFIDGDKNAKIDIDRINRRVLFGARYSFENESRILSISMDEGSNDVINAASIFNNNVFNGLLWVKPEDKNTFLLSNILNNGSIVQIFKNDTSLYGNYVKFEDINKNYMFPSFDDSISPQEESIDSTRIESWVCIQVCHGQDPINCTKQLGVDNVSFGVCDPIKIDISDKTLYIMDKKENIIYIKTRDTFSFNIRMLPVFINDSNINEMEVSSKSKQLFYSNKISNKLYSVNLNNSTDIRVILEESPTSFKYYDGNIYYSINGSKIEKISIIPGSTAITLFDSNPMMGHCVCNIGFTGKDCNCDTTNDKNMIIYDNTVIKVDLLGLLKLRILETGPKCVPTVNRIPLTCNDSYQCNLDKKRYETKTELYCKQNSKGYNTCMN